MHTQRPFATRAGQAQCLDVLGIGHTVLVDGRQSAGRLALLEVQMPVGAGIPPHVHTREDEAFFVLDGEVEFRLGDQTVRGGPGFTVYGPRGAVHAYRNSGPAVARMLVSIVPAGIEPMFAEIAAIPVSELDPVRLGGIVARFGISFA